MQFIDKLLVMFNTGELGYVGIYQYFVSIHITAGVIAMTCGTIVLFMLKGGTLHKKIGKGFIYGMLLSGCIGPVIVTLGELTQPSALNFMTSTGGLVVLSMTWSGWRLAKVGMRANGAIDKFMLGIAILSVLLYSFYAVLISAGTDVFGLQALTTQKEQVTMAMHSYSFFEKTPWLVATTGGTIFGVIISENLAGILFYVVVMSFFIYQDWGRVMKTRKYTREQVINQHFTRILYIWGSGIAAILLNTGWVSYYMCWQLPEVFALLLALYFIKNGYTKPQRPGASAQAA